MLLPANFALRVTTNDMNFAEPQYNYKHIRNPSDTRR